MFSASKGDNQNRRQHVMDQKIAKKPKTGVFDEKRRRSAKNGQNQQTVEERGLTLR